jgi:hypothetical protein
MEQGMSITMSEFSLEGYSRQSRRATRVCDPKKPDLRVTSNLSRLPLTSAEAALVELATVRAGSTHKRWPTEVIEYFLAADLVGQTTEQDILWNRLVFKLSRVRSCRRMKLGLFQR